MTNDQENYYSRITNITVNGKNAYELKGKFLDDLHNNAFSGTKGEDAVKHSEYLLKIIDPIDLPNVNQDKLRVIVFLILLVGDAWKWFDEIKGSIDSWVDLTVKFFRKYYLPSLTSKINTQMIKWDPNNPKFKNWLASKFVNYKTMDIFTKRALWDFWKLVSDEIEPTNEEPSDLEETDHDDEQEIGEIFRIETNLFDYETPLCEKFKEFNYLLKIDLISLLKTLKDSRLMKNLRTIGFTNGTKMCHGWRNDGYYNGGNLPGAYIVGNSFHYQYYKWYEALEDRELKEEALRNKDIMEGIIEDDDDESIDERQELCGNETHELPVCNIRRFEMIKYLFGDDEEYVAVKEDEYDDLTSTRKDACRAYQEIFRMMDEGWMVTRDE
ncbi:hypothetical protein Tco_1419737 [Tanacetum coccineum]